MPARGTRLRARDLQSEPLVDAIATRELERRQIVVQDEAATRAALGHGGHRHVSGAEAREMVHGSSTAGRFNNRLAVVITRAVGTMWCAYAFAALALISFPQALAALQRGDTLAAVTWLSQSFLQLVLLPIIIVGQNVSAAASDARAEADHETLAALRASSVRELRILEQQQQILELLRDRGSAGGVEAGARPA